MELKFTVPFLCDSPEIEPHLQKVFYGEYDVPIGFPAGTRVLDLGANCGAFSVWATHRWPGCLIEAYEPNPKTFAILQKNVQAFPLITAHNYGLGEAGMRVLYHGTYNSGESSFHMAANNSKLTGEHLEVRDPLTLPEADIIKLDIEGCEVEVLSPLIKAGRKFDLVMLEWHNFKLKKKVSEILSDYTEINCLTEDLRGRGVSKYLHTSIIEGIAK